MSKIRIIIQNFRYENNKKMEELMNSLIHKGNKEIEIDIDGIKLKATVTTVRINWEEQKHTIVVDSNE